MHLRPTAAEQGSRDQIFDNRVDRKSTRLNSSHLVISYAVFCLKKNEEGEKKSTHKPLLGKRMSVEGGSGYLLASNFLLSPPVWLSVERGRVFFLKDWAPPDFYLFPPHDAFPP